jgi:hypothetical protein
MKCRHYRPEPPLSPFLLPRAQPRFGLALPHLTHRRTNWLIWARALLWLFERVEAGPSYPREAISRRGELLTRVAGVDPKARADAKISKAAWRRTQRRCSAGPRRTPFSATATRSRASPLALLKPGPRYETNKTSFLRDGPIGFKMGGAESQEPSKCLLHRVRKTRTMPGYI